MGILCNTESSWTLSYSTGEPCKCWQLSQVHLPVEWPLPGASQLGARDHPQTSPSPVEYCPCDMDELGALPEQREAQWFAQEGKSPLASCSGLHLIGVHRLQYEIHTEFCTARRLGWRLGYEARSACPARLFLGRGKEGGERRGGWCSVYVRYMCMYGKRVLSCCFYTYMYTYTRARTHTHTHTHMHAHTHTHTHTYTHSHTRWVVTSSNGAASRSHWMMFLMAMWRGVKQHWQKASSAARWEEERDGNHQSFCIVFEGALWLLRTR